MQGLALSNTELSTEAGRHLFMPRASFYSILLLQKSSQYQEMMRNEIGREDNTMCTVCYETANYC